MKLLQALAIPFLSLLILGITFCTKTETPAVVPTLITQAPISITSSSAVVGGYVSSDGGALVTERGICCSKNHHPVIADIRVPGASGTGDFRCLIPGLEQSTIYYARSYAINNAGVGYGAEVQFETLAENGGTGSVTDIDGNVYPTVQIGSQTWMAENLKVTHYRDGSPIATVSDSASWISLTKGAYCWYNNDSVTYSNVYGALYNWYAVTDSRHLCPSGWHVPTDAGWKTLTNLLGGDSVAATQMKSSTGWDFNGNGTNASGFNGLPGGARSNNGRYLGMGWFEPWWSITEYTDTHALLLSIYCCNSKVDRSPYNKQDGLSVRCVKD